ncbi:hypothetical protein ZWY2020_006224 [Hordeum vulgare]|nr:hypothetical protein ZWY2020_006224 [Hordeum vulgare]
MASSPTSVSASPCRNGDRLVVSGLDISSRCDSPVCNDANEVSSRSRRGEGAAGAPLDGVGGSHEPWVPPSKRSLSRCTHEWELQVLQSHPRPPSPSSPPRVMSPDMKGLCFAASGRGTSGVTAPTPSSASDLDLKTFSSSLRGAEDRNKMSIVPAIDHPGVNLFFRQWNRHAQAVHVAFQFKVKLILEGKQTHAWGWEVVESLLGSSYVVDSLEYERCSRADLMVFRLSAWTVQPDDIPSLRWLAISEPGLAPPLTEPTLLRSKVLIHLDEILDYKAVEEPWFLVTSSGIDHSGIPGSDNDVGFGGGGGVRSERTN